MSKLKTRVLDFPPSGADDIASTYVAVEDARYDQAAQPPAIVCVAHGFAKCFSCEGSTNCEHAVLALREVDEWE